MPSSSDEVESCLNLQSEEWEVLESIYPDYLSGDRSKDCVRLEIPVEPSESIVVGTNIDSQSHTRDPTLISLSSLPPLLLDIILPPTYPLSSPPQILSLYSSHSWLSSTSILGLDRLLIGMWIPGEGVLYSWIECIRSGEILESLGLVDRQGGNCIRIPSLELPQLLPHLITYNSSAQQLRFSQTSYNCEICLTSIKGARCMLLSCSHVFCRGCLEDFWKLCISEGDAGRVGCPDPHCVKEGREANEEEVRRVVTEQEVQRWKWLKKKREWENDPTVIHCPLPFCQAPVPKPMNVEEGSGWDRLRTCPECDYSFCSYCKHGWHGPLSECPISLEESFIAEYLGLPEDSSQRKHYERRYGLSIIQRLVKKFKEDQANRDWLKSSTMACPICQMTCAKCQAHFCYRCGQKLDGGNPYKHFNIPGQPCFSKLFDLRDSEEDEWQPIEGFDAL